MIGRAIGGLMVGLIRLYQTLLSPMLGARCRFYPSCSRYAAESIQTHGPLVGLFLGTRRLLRCHPWNAGGVDLVPPRGGVRAYVAHTDCSHPDRIAPHPS